MAQTYDRVGDRLLIGEDDILAAYHAPTRATLGIWHFDEGTGWTRDDRDFTDVAAWRAHVTTLAARF